MLAAERQQLPDGRQHWRHGPIDLVIEARGEPAAVAAAHAAAWCHFEGLLAELVAELGALRSPVSASPVVRGQVARRMLAACLPYAPEFITPMAAVAGSVADEIVRFFDLAGVERACVNNGGDIAIHLAPGQSLRIGLVADAYRPSVDADLTLDANGPVRGIATSGWRGRSFSLGVADSVTVLASTAATADAAATMIANAVDVDHPAIRRKPACEVKDDSDLGARLVTVDVGELPRRLVIDALERGAAAAATFLDRGLIIGAALALQKQWRTIGAAALSLPDQRAQAVPTWRAA
jgi:ApbE superfamily uncharacterized protein (UPF0280 family)